MNKTEPLKADLTCINKLECFSEKDPGTHASVIILTSNSISSMPAGHLPLK